MARKTGKTVEIAPGITVDPGVRFGRPVIKGTRVPIAVILDELGGGSGIEEVAAEYGVGVADVRAVLRYAADMVAGEELLVAAG